MRVYKILGHEVDVDRIENYGLKNIVKKLFVNKFIFSYGDHTDKHAEHRDYNDHAEGYMDYDNSTY